MVLIDSPGFDDTTRTDIDILKIIGVHLQQGSQKNKLLSGIIYMRRITDNRMQGSALNNLRILRKLCGVDNYGHIVLVTSQWDVVVPADGENREKQLCEDFWADMRGKGAKVERHFNNRESAIKILREFVPQKPFELEFQKQFIAMGGNVAQTDVGKEILQILFGKISDYQNQITKLKEDNKRAEIEMAKMVTEIQNLKEDMKQSEKKRERERERDKEREKELIDNLSSMKELINEAKIAKEKAESDMQDLKKEIENVQQGKRTAEAIEVELKSKEELAAEAKAAEGKAEEDEGEKDNVDIEMQGLMTEIEKLKEEMERQKAITEDLKRKEQLLGEAEALKKRAETKKREAEENMLLIQKEVDKVQLGEKDRLIAADLELKKILISQREEERDDEGHNMIVSKTKLEKLRGLESIARDAIKSVEEPANDEVYFPQTANSKTKRSKLRQCAVQ